MRFNILDEHGSVANTIIADLDFVQNNFSNYTEISDPVVILDSDVTKSYIDIGPFFDRFGAAKLPILMSADLLVKAILSDIQVRKWIDLQRPDVGQALDVLISKSLLTLDLKTAILDTPVSADENMVLKKLYFS